VVGAILTFAAALLLLPKIRAEARKLNAEAGATEWGTLRDEINRLQERVDAQGSRIAELEKLDGERADREAGLVKENRQLRQKVRKLETRIAGLESVFKIGPITPEMQAELDKLKDVD
jgi:gas vesicle protein